MAYAAGERRKAHARYMMLSRAIADVKAAPHRWPVGDYVDIHERPVEGYRIYYRVDDGLRRVRILRVFSPFQDRSVL